MGAVKATERWLGDEVKSLLGRLCAGGALCLAAGAAQAADIPTKAANVTEQSSNWTINYTTDVRYFSWTGTRGFPSNSPLAANGRGTMVYAPMSLSASGNVSPDFKLDFVARGGYVSAKQTTANETGSVSTPVDTQLSATGTYYGFTGFQPFVSLMVNLPTGKSALYGNDRFARMDPDLVDLQTYGEGLNLGPTVGVNIPLTPSLVMTLSAGYTARGAFNKEGPAIFVPQPSQRVRNGNESTVTVALAYGEGPFSANGSVAYSWDTQSTVDGVAQYRAGSHVLFSGALGYAFDSNWSATLDGYLLHTNRNDVPDITGTVLIPEAFNSNSNLVRLNAGLKYAFENGITVGPIASFLYRDSNAWNPTTLNFVPAKTRWSVGATGGYTVNKKLTLNARLEHIWTRENIHPDLPAFPGSGVPDMTGRSWMISAGLTYALN